MNLILRNTDRIEMSMAEFIDFTKSVVKEAVAETYGEYISRMKQLGIWAVGKNWSKQSK